MQNVTNGQLHKPDAQRRLAVVLRWRVRLVSHAKVNANWARHRLVLAESTHAVEGSQHFSSNGTSSTIRCSRPRARVGGAVSRWISAPGVVDSPERHRSDAPCQPGRESCRPMRLLVACPECPRQYDASRRHIGSRFRCHCGALVEVRQPQGHDARVVRCSSSGRRGTQPVLPFLPLGLHAARAQSGHGLPAMPGTGQRPGPLLSPLRAPAWFRSIDAGTETAFCCPACRTGGA